MTKIVTVCTFACPPGGIDLVRRGKALITAHHQIQTAMGWMTARQAARQGLGKLIYNFSAERVYNLCLEGGGNIIINTTAHQQEALTVAATMGYRFEPTKDSQHTGSLTYPLVSLQRLGLHKGMSTGRRHFHTCEVSTQPNGEIILKSPIPGDNRFETPTRAFPRATITPQSRAPDSKTVVQLESAATSEKVQEGKKGVLKTRPKELPDIALSEVEIFQPPLNGPLWNREGTKEDPPEPSLTPDTYLLTSDAGKASGTQLRTIAKGTTVVQSLPSGNIEDIGRARVTTTESICPYQRPTGEVILAKMGMACVTAHLVQLEAAETSEMVQEGTKGELKSNSKEPLDIDIVLKSPIPDDNKIETPTRPFPRDTITSQHRASDPQTAVPLESAATSEMVQEGKKGELKTRPIRPLDIDFSEIEIETFQPPLKGATWNRDGTKEDPPEPSLTPDTYLLTRNAGKASWTQLGTVAKDTIVFQSSPRVTWRI